MRHHFWTVLFGIVFIFSVIRERQFILIYYTVLTFMLELSYFLCKSLRWTSMADALWPFMMAPAIVVCIGFWIIVAPMQFTYQPTENIVMVFVTHGLNMVAVIFEKKKVFLKDIWKPVLYTIVYNVFLAIYVGGGGRSISGKLPYWYAQYDQPIGLIFAALAVTAAGVTHFTIASPEPEKISKQYIV